MIGIGLIMTGMGPIGYTRIHHGEKLEDTILWKVLQGQGDGEDASFICNTISTSF